MEDPQTSNGMVLKSSTTEKVIYKGCEISDKKDIANIYNEHFVSPTAHIKPTRSSFVFCEVMTFQVEKAMKN